jgi:hypothetical protein
VTNIRTSVKLRSVCVSPSDHGLGACPDAHVDFAKSELARADRAPFFFARLHEATGEILLLDRVLEPSQM